MPLAPCPDCGKLCSRLAEKCVNCGRPLITETALTQRPEEKKDWDERPMHPLVAILLVTAIIAMCGFCATRKPSDNPTETDLEKSRRRTIENLSR